MDDLLSLLGDESSSSERQENARKSGSGTRTESSSSLNKASRVVSPPRPDAASRSAKRGRERGKPAASSAATVCEHTRLRIVNRRLSRLDMVDSLAPHDFRTAPALAAMSVRDLSSLVTVPSKDGGGNSGGFAGGRSNLATMGVLFKNSGTKISSSGRAFSIFTIGDLASGPCVSVFLFGEAYSSHTKQGCLSGKPGSIVAVLAPNILPSRKGGETSITLSVSDEGQIAAVGAAQDYGTCAGTAWSRRGGEQTKARCSNYVDLRTSRYCHTHRGQANQQQASSSGAGGRGTGSATGAGGGGGTFLQKARAEHGNDRMFSAFRGGDPGGANSTAATQHTQRGAASATSMSSQFPGAACRSRGGMASSSDFSAALAQSGFLNDAPPKATTMTMDTPAGAVVTRTSGSVRQLRAPMHMKKAGASLSGLSAPSSSSVPSRSGGNRNPYDRRPAAGATGRQATPQTRDRPQARSAAPRNGGTALNDILGGGRADASRSAAKRRASAQSSGGGDGKSRQGAPKGRKIAKFEDFDGSVQVPKPSRAIFGGSRGVPLGSQGAQAEALAGPDPQEVLERQRMLAGRIRIEKGGNGTPRSGGGSRGLSAAANQHAIAKRAASSGGRRLGTASSAMDSLFEGMEALDREEVLSAKSKYHSEEDAERYARARQAVNDLEKKETRQDNIERRKKAKAKRKGAGEGGSAIVTKWVCGTCGRTSDTNPLSCVMRNHAVKVKREIKETQGKREARDKLQSKDVEDGGVTLGSGLEWSGWRGKNA